MKIAFLNIYNGIVERGSEIFVDEMAQQFTKENRITVIQSGYIGRKSYQIKQIRGIPFIKNQNFLYDFFVLLFTLKSIPHLWMEKYDWIIPINGRWQVIICRVFRFLRGGKLLISGHAGIGFEDHFNIRFGQPDIFVAISPEALQWAGKLTSNAIYIPNGVDIEKFNPQVKPIKLDLKKPIIFCNSALLKYKRVDLVIKAVSKLIDVQLLIIGDGPLKKEIEKLGQQLLGERFKLLSSVPHEEMPKYYTAADIFTLVSEKSEAFGLVYLEALACNIPVVVPDDINRREIIGDAGLYTHPEDTNSYKETLKKALSKKWGNIPKTQADKYSWEIIASKYLKEMAI